MLRQESLGCQIFDAVKKDNLELAQSLLARAREDKQPWDDYIYDDHGDRQYRAIHRAVMNHSLPMTKLLLENGANVHHLVHRRDGGYPRNSLWYALKQRDTEIVLLLLPYYNFNNPEEILCERVLENDYDSAKVLMEYAKKHKPLSTWDKICLRDMTHHAAMHDDNIPMLTLLFENDATLDNAEKYIADAVKNKNYDFAKVLVEHAKKHKQSMFRHEWNDENTNNSPIHWAVINNHLPMLRLLLENGANVHCMNKDGKTALMLALENNNEEIQSVLEHHINMLRLEKAILENDINSVKLLLNYSLLNQALPGENLTPLELAIKHNQKQIVQYLIMQGAKANNHDDKKGQETQKLFYQYSSAESTLDAIIDQAKESTKQLSASIGARISQEEKNEYLVFSNEILIAISDVLKSLHSASETMTANEKMDLIILIKSLLNAIKTTETKSQCIEKCKLILAEREDAILDSSMDYCYTDRSLANRLCLLLAEKIADEKTPPQNILLTNACTKDRFATSSGVNVKIMTEEEFKNSNEQHEHGNYIVVINEKNLLSQHNNF